MANEEKKEVAQTPKMVLKILIGIILLVVGAVMVWVWKQDVLTVIKGFLGMVVILAGIIFLAIAKE